jgi:hypothetical protein
VLLFGIIFDTAASFVALIRLLGLNTKARAKEVTEKDEFNRNYRLSYT